MIGCFYRVCLKRGLRGNVAKSRVMVVGGEVGAICDIEIKGERIGQMQELRYLECMIVMSLTSS